MESYKKLSEYDIRTVLSMTDLFPTLVDNGDGTYTNKVVPLSSIRVYSAVPGGGTTGQYLKKTSNTDYATQWASPSKTDVGLSNVDNTADINKPVSTAVTTAIQALYPIGSIYINATNSTNPGTLLGFGTWSAFGAGRVPIGVGTSDQAFTAGATGGESNHLLTVAEMPAHTHPDYPINYGFTPTGANAVGAMDISAGIPQSFQTGSTGGGGTHNNLPPYIVVYMWRRTA